MEKKKLSKLHVLDTKFLKSELFHTLIKTLPHHENGLAIYMDSVSSDDKNQQTTYLVFAALDNRGEPDTSKTVSVELPCPPFCGGKDDDKLLAMTR